MRCLLYDVPIGRSHILWDRVICFVSINYNVLSSCCKYIIEKPFVIRWFRLSIRVAVHWCSIQMLYTIWCYIEMCFSPSWNVTWQYVTCKINAYLLAVRPTPVSEKKFPPLNSLLLCQILTDFQNFCLAGKRMKCATKTVQHYPPHLRRVACVLRLRFDKVRESLKLGTFLRHSG